MNPPRHRHLYLGVAVAGLLALLLADLELTATRPGETLSAMLSGLLRPDLGMLGESALWQSLASTLAVALWGIALALLLGALLALGYERRAVRVLCAGLRSVHELLWALLLLPAFGSSLVTGMLALALPAAGIFGKVLAEIRQEADPAPAAGLPAASGALSRFAYGVLPVIAPACRHYIAYRFECALRASAVLGFVGVPTIGYELEAVILQGEWPQVTTLLSTYILLVAACRWLLRPWSALALWLLAALWMRWAEAWQRSSLEATLRYLQELVPWPLRRPAEGAADALGARLAATGDWLLALLGQQALPGLWATLVLGVAGAALATLGSLLLLPLGSRGLLGRWPARAGDLLLIAIRTVPSYLLAFVGVLVCGPSMLPGILALGVHDGAILAHLGAGHADRIALRVDAPRRRLDRYAYELLPRIAGSHLAYALYRFEVILRESAILGVIGIATIGFHIDSAIQEHKPDEALILVLATAGLIIAVDALSQRLRRLARLRTSPEDR